MKNLNEKMNVTLLSRDEIPQINGGGVLRSYGEAFGEAVGGLAIKIGFALAVRRWI